MSEIAYDSIGPVVICPECGERLKSHAGRGHKYFHEWAHGPYNGSSSGKCSLDGMAFEMTGIPVTGSDTEREALVHLLHGDKIRKVYGDK